MNVFKQHFFFFFFLKPSHRALGVDHGASSRLGHELILVAPENTLFVLCLFCLVFLVCCCFVFLLIVFHLHSCSLERERSECHRGSKNAFTERRQCPCPKWAFCGTNLVLRKLLQSNKKVIKKRPLFSSFWVGPEDGFHISRSKTSMLKPSSVFSWPFCSTRGKLFFFFRNFMIEIVRGVFCFQMLDHFAILSRGGAVLWSRTLSPDFDGQTPVNSLIQKVLLEVSLLNLSSFFSST